MNSNERKGELAVITQTGLAAIFPVLATLTYVKITPLISLAFTSLFAAIFFGSIITFKKTWKQLANKRVLPDLIGAAIILGTLFYVFYFLGLKYSTSGNVSLVCLLEIFFSFMFFNVWHKEYISAEHILGAVFMVAGALVILTPKAGHWYAGNFLVVISAIIAPLGNLFQRRAREKVDSEIIMFARSIIGFFAVLLITYFLGEKISPKPIVSLLPILILNGILPFGLAKMLWIEGIHRISVTKALSLTAIGPILTIFFSYLILHQGASKWQLISFVPMSVGLILLTRKVQAKDTGLESLN